MDIISELKIEHVDCDSRSHRLTKRSFDFDSPQQAVAMVRLVQRLSLRWQPRIAAGWFAGYSRSVKVVAHLDSAALACD